MLRDEIKVDDFTGWTAPRGIPCRGCIYSRSKNSYQDGPQKASCVKYPFPRTKPLGVIEGKDPCPLYKDK